MVKEAVGIGVEVEPCKRHDEIEKFVLYGEDNLGELIEFQHTFVVGGPQGFEKCRGNGEKGHVFYIRVASFGIRKDRWQDFGIKAHWDG